MGGIPATEIEAIPRAGGPSGSAGVVVSLLHAPSA